MSTPPNSFVSDIRFITPGSSELDNFLEKENELYQDYIKKESKRYLMNPSEFENTLHKDFDVSKATINHLTIPTKCTGELICIDELLSPLVELINRDELLTTQSCQYNNSGYSYISFTLEGFQKWCNFLLKKAIEKYGDDSYYDCKILERFSYTEIDRKMNVERYKKRNLNNIVYFTSGIYHGVHEFIFGVTWMFLPEDIELIYKELKDLIE